MAKKTSKGKPSVRRRLGRGLESLISAPVEIEAKPARERVPSVAPSSARQSVQTSGQVVDGGDSPAAPANSSGSSSEPGMVVQMLELSQLRANPKQPRRDFDEASLDRLAKSIQSAGVMQPIVVRPRSDAAGFEIVAGERRFRAASKIGLERIPAVVHIVDDRTAAEWALVENLQREDLNPIERGEAFRRLIHEFGMTHQDVAETVGLDRSSVTNHLRLNELDTTTRDAVRAGQLSMGHGRALLGLANILQRQELARAGVKQGWSVRELERRIRGLKQSAEKQAAAAESAAGEVLAVDPVRLHMDDLEKQLGELLGTKVAIQTGNRKGTGRLTMSFYSIDQFEGILERLGYRGT